MKMEDKINSLLNKGFNNSAPTVERQKDERYLSFVTSKRTLPQDMDYMDITNYKFALVPFKEGVNYLPMEALGAVYVDGVMTKRTRGRLKNFYTNKYIQNEHGAIRYNHLADLMFYGTSKNTENGICDPLGLFESHYFDTYHKSFTEEQSKAVRVNSKTTYLCQLLVINDPIQPENNGKIKLQYVKQGLFDKIVQEQTTYNQETLMNEFTELKKLGKNQRENEDRINELVEYIDANSLNIFDTNKGNHISITFDLKLNSMRPDLYSTAKIVISDTPLNIPQDELYSLKDLVIEQKEKYVPKNLKTNLKSLGWTEEKIFEYKAFMDLYDHIKDSEDKLIIFNEINKYNFDVNLVTQENYTPSINLLKNDTTPTQKVEKKPVVEQFKSDDEEIDFNTADELDDELPF